mgnify:CR=1 FL=1
MAAGGAFVPTDLGSLVSWHTADDISTLWTDSARTDQVDANDDVVGAWDDKSGNGNHLLQATTAQKPTYKTNTLNGKPTILGDGTADNMAASFALAKPTHVFIVAKAVTWTNGDRIYDGYSDNDMALHQTGTTPDIKIYADAAGPVSDANMAVGTFYLVEAQFNGASSWIKVADNAKSTGAVGTATDPDGLRLFASATSGGYGNLNIAEIVLCTGEITGSDLSDLRSYFNTEWGVTTSPVSITSSGLMLVPFRLLYF